MDLYGVIPEEGKNNAARRQPDNWDLPQLGLCLAGQIATSWYNPASSRRCRAILVGEKEAHLLDANADSGT